MTSFHARASRLAGAAILAASLAACSSSSAPKADPGPPTPLGNVTQGTAMPFVRTAADITTHDGQPVTAVGTYEIEDLGRYRVAMTLPDGTVFKTNKAVYLKLSDGTDLRIGARSDEEREQLGNQQVEVEATVLSKPPPPDDPKANQMSPMPTLVDIKSIRAAK